MSREAGRALSRTVPGANTDYLAAAVQWIRERGGVVKCARVVAQEAGGAEPSQVRPALERMGAPVGTFGLLGAALHALKVAEGLRAGGPRQMPS
jgi:hypothetical protein